MLMASAAGAEMKRIRGGSISGRLRACSDLEENGFISKADKSLLKVCSTTLHIFLPR